MQKIYTILFLFIFSGLIAQTWINIGPGGGSDLQTILIQPDNPNILYVGGDIEGIFKSEDGGKSWFSINSNLATGPWTPDVYWTNQFKYDLSDNTYNTIFYCSAVAMFKTTNRGESWQLIFPTEITNEDELITVQSMAQNPNNHQNIIVGTSGRGVFSTNDGGSNWNKISLPMNDTATVYGAEITGNSEILLATNVGFFYSPDMGTTWEKRTVGLPHDYIWNMKLVNEIVYVTLATFGTQGNSASFSGGIFKSTNMGQAWRDLTSDLPRMQSDGLFYYYWKFDVNPLNPNTIFIGTSVGYPDETLAAYEDWGIYKTTNGGASWSRNDLNLTAGWMDETFFDERHALVLAIAKGDTNTVYWGRDWMNKTTNGGDTWTQIYTTKVGNAWKGTGFELMMTECMAFSPNDPNKLFIGYDDMGPFRSDDNANSFLPLDPSMDPFDGYDAAKVIRIDPENNDLYIARYDGIGSAFTNGYTIGKIYFSGNDGITQTPISNGFPDGRPDMEVDFTKGTPGNRTIYATSFTNGIYKSTNSGSNWTAINSGLGTDSEGVWVIKLNPNNTDELYLGINNFGGGGGMYKSTDAGANWNRISSFPSLDVHAIEYDAVNNIIYVGASENYDWSVTGGLYKSTDDGATWRQISDMPRIADIAINPENPQIFFIVSQPWYAVWLPDTPLGIFRTTDGGNSFENITNDLAHAFVLFIELNPNNTSQLFAGTGGGGLWVADNVTSVEEKKNSIPTEFVLSQNYPNPFNPSTTIKYSLPSFDKTHTNFSGESQHLVQLQVYDLLGRKVATLVNQRQSPGNYEVKLKAMNLPSGMYIYQITAGKYRASGKMLLMK